MSGFFSGLWDRLAGKDRFCAKHEENDGFSRAAFSEFLNLYCYDDDNETYINADGSYGWIWECSPLVFANGQTLDNAEGLLRLNLPDYCVLTFTLHADPDISDIVDNYRQLRTGETNSVIKHSADSYADYLLRCSKQGAKSLSGIPLRNYRLFVSLKFTTTDDMKLNDIKGAIISALDGIGFAPKFMEPPQLLYWLRKIFNKEVSATVNEDGIKAGYRYNEDKFLAKQIIFSDTVIRNEEGVIEAGGKYFKALTPMNYPDIVDPLKTKQLFGGIMGVNDDSNQYKTPWLYSFHIVFDNQKTGIQLKADMILKQQAFGSLAKQMHRKQSDLSDAVDKMQQGENYYRIMPVIWFYGESEVEVEESCSRCRRMWDSQGFLMQGNDYIANQLLYASIPFGLKLDKDLVNAYSRFYTVDAAVAVNLLPIQTDFKGSINEPALIYQGRTGQIVSTPIFTSLSNAFNGFIAAPPGAGKSVQANFILENHYAMGTLIRIIDIGGSYERACHIFGGRYLDFRPDLPICLNPFSGVVEFDSDSTAIREILLQMIYSGVEDPYVSQNEISIAEYAIEYAWKKNGNDATMDDVREFLSNYPGLLPEGITVTGELVTAAHHMAFNMGSFCSGGKYSRYFIGKADFNIRTDRYVVLELGKLKNDPPLFRVVTLLVLNAVQNDLWFSEKGKDRRLILFDEAWQVLGESSGNGKGGNRMITSMIEGGFRKARKHEAGFWVVSQSVLDCRNFGAVGDVIWSFSDYKILLQSPDYDKAVASGLLEQGDMSVRLMKSVRRVGTQYSEAFIVTPYGQGVVRLALTPFSYYLYTSNGREVNEIESLVKEGATYEEAIIQMCRRYRSE